MPLNMGERKAITKELRMRYLKVRKKQKKVILDEFCLLTGYNRSYAARALRKKDSSGKRGTSKKKRDKIYREDVFVPLRKIWAILDGICGKRLVAVLPEIVPRLESFGEIKLSDEAREKLLSISASTIDRMLAPERRKFKLKDRQTTKPGTLLKRHIPIRTFSEWDEARPGFLEVDLVSHDGGDPKGDFAQTLDMVDVFTGWCETRAVKNKAQKWVFEALLKARESFPFDVLGIDSDNGSEFINIHLVRFCEQEKINFTRSRPYRKNDSCYVEQKNWSVVRRNVGYLRYDTDEEIRLLNELYQHLRLYTNFFLPQMKLVEKTRQGAKVKKRYDRPKTPYQRLLALPDVSAQTKKQLAKLYANLNPAQLRRKINGLQDNLFKLCQLKEEIRKKEVLGNLDFEYILNDATKDPLEYISK